MAGAADEIIVQITADSAGVAVGLQSAADQVRGAEQQMANAVSAAADQIKQAQASMAEGAQGAAAEFGAASDTMQGSMDTLVANIEAGVAAAKAEIADMVATMGGGTAGLGATEGIAADAAAFNAAAVARAAASGNLSAAMAGGITTTEDLATAETALDQAMAAGALSGTEYAAIQEQLATAEAALTAEVDANTGSLEANTGAQLENDAARGGGGKSGGVHGVGVFRAVTWAMREMMTPTGAVVGVLGTLALATGIAEGKMGELNLALIADGDAAGVTGGEMNAWSNTVADAMGTVQDARTAYSALAQSGLFIGTALREAGSAAIQWSEVTGTSSQAAAQAIEKMAENPVSAIRNLTSAQAQEVESLLEMGNKAEAGRVAVASLSADLNAQESSIEANIPWWDKWGDAIANAAEKGGEAIKNMMGIGDLPQRIGAAKDKLHSDESGGFLHYFLGGPLAPHASALQIMRDKAHLHLLEADLHTREATAAHHADVHHARMGAVEAEAQVHALYMQGHPHAAAVQRVDEMLRHIVAGGGTLPAGVTQSGTTFGGSGFDALVGEAGGNAAPKGAHAHYVAPPGSNAGWDVGRMGHYDTAMMGVEAHHIATQQHAAQTARQISAITLESSSAHQVATQQLQQQHIQAMVGMGTMGGASAVAQEQTIADKIYQIKLAELEKEKALQATKPVEAARINSEIVRLQDSHVATMQSLSDKAAAVEIKNAQGVVSPVLSTFAQITAGFAEGTLTRQQAELRMGEALVAHEIQWGIQKLVNHLAIDNAKTLVTMEGEAKRLALTLAAEVEAGAIHVAHAIAWIVTEAAKAASSAFTAMAGIPPAPLWGVAAAAAAFAGVEAFISNVASAAGGWDRVPMDNAPAMLHKDEMVLPADLAEGVRNMSGGGGNTYHYHIHANDAAGFEGMLKRNPGALVRALGHAHAVGAMA